MRTKETIFYLFLLSVFVFQFLPLISGAENCNGLCDPLNLPEEKPIAVLAGKVINVILGIVGSLALIMFIYGGITWMTAGGNEQRVKTGRNILVWTVLGLVVIFSSYAILKFVFQALGVD
ncbi:MAG: pilin [bacterium]